MKKFLLFEEFTNISETIDEYYGRLRIPEKWYHGSTDKKIEGKKGIHIGSKLAATQALEARIGVPAEGEWDGTREYGKTKLMGKRNLNKLEQRGIFKITGYNIDAPEEDYFPTEVEHRAFYSDKTEISFTSKPIIFEVEIIGKMSNSPWSPMGDMQANSIMHRHLKKGNARSGYYYQNIAEDAGSVSAVVPDKSFIRIKF